MYSAAQAYARTAKATVSPRDLEAQLLLKAAYKIQTAKDGWPNTFDDLQDALTYDRRLWTILVTSATSAENPLPDMIKNNIANIGVFVLGRILEMQMEPRPEKLDVLVRINRDIAAGLASAA